MCGCRISRLSLQKKQNIQNTRQLTKKTQDMLTHFVQYFSDLTLISSAMFLKKNVTVKKREPPNYRPRYSLKHSSCLTQHADNFRGTVNETELASSLCYLKFKLRVKVSYGQERTFWSEKIFHLRRQKCPRKGQYVNREETQENGFQTV